MTKSGIFVLQSEEQLSLPGESSRASGARGSVSGGEAGEVAPSSVRKPSATLDSPKLLSALESALKDSFSGVLLLPLRTLRGGFCWATTRSALARLLAATGGLQIELPEIDSETALVPERSGCLRGENLYVEEYAFKGIEHPVLNRLGHSIGMQALSSDPRLGWWPRRLSRDLAVLEDRTFQLFAELLTRPSALRREVVIPRETVLMLPTEIAILHSGQEAGEQVGIGERLLPIRHRRGIGFLRSRYVERIELLELPEPRPRPGKRSEDSELKQDGSEEGEIEGSPGSPVVVVEAISN